MTKLFGKQNGRFGKHHTVEAKELIGNAQRNKIVSDVTRKKMSVAKLNCNLSDDTKQKLRETHFGERNGMFGKSGRLSPMKGKTFSLTDEQRLKVKDARAKQILPLKDTTIEVKIQNFLKQLGVDFFTHQHIKNIEHGYQCDILIPSMNLVIECDGDYWHKYPIGNDIDHIRTSELINAGFRVLRLWECEIIPMTLADFRKQLQGRSNKK